MLTPEQIKEFMALHMKELLRENLTIETKMDRLFGTMVIKVKYDGENISETQIYGSDIEVLLAKDVY